MHGRARSTQSLTQQLREPDEERALRDSIPRLTAIDDEVSQRVRQQYEENPYPRWANAPGPGEPVTLANYLHAIDAVAPCSRSSTKPAASTCWWPAAAPACTPLNLQGFCRSARVLAVDLSLTSLAYAKRKTPPDLAQRLSYAQADILKLDAIGRSFDIIDASGVLHHMARSGRGLA